MSNRLKIFLPFGILVVLVLLIPVCVMFAAGFQSVSGNFSLINYQQILTNSYYREAITNSLQISLVTSLFSILVALFGAWSLTRLTTGAKNILLTVFNMSSSFAGVPLAFSLIILFGNAGVWKAISTAIGWHVGASIYSITGMTFAYTFFEIPLGIMFLFPVLSSLNHEWLEVSNVLGASKVFFLQKVILPVVLPNIVQVFILLFANAMGTYETAYALVGDNLVSIPTLIGSLINGEIVANVPLACAFATVFAVVMALIVWVGNRLTRNQKEG
jgi:putative spermidine/putrescine transport system permease protein